MGVGRIGCFLVGCCWGAECPANLPWAVQFPPLSMPAQQQWSDREVTLPAELILVDPPTGVAVPMPHEFLKLSEADLDRNRAQLPRLDEQIEKARASKNTIEEGKLTARKLGLQAVFAHLDTFNLTPEKLRALASSPEYRSRPVHPAQIYSAIGPLLLAWLLSAYFYRRKRHGTVMALAMILYGIERFIEESVRMDNPMDTFGLTVSQGVSICVVTAGILWWLILKQMSLRSYHPPIKNSAHPPAPAIAQPA
jgi:prolipoprotein diacylglyceryltransferase